MSCHHGRKSDISTWIDLFRGFRRFVCLSCGHRWVEKEAFLRGLDDFDS